MRLAVVGEVAQTKIPPILHPNVESVLRGVPHHILVVLRAGQMIGCSGIWARVQNQTVQPRGSRFKGQGERRRGTRPRKKSPEVEGTEEKEHQGQGVKGSDDTGSIG